MIRRPPRSTRTDTLFPYTTLFRSIANRALTKSAHRLRYDRGWTMRNQADPYLDIQNRITGQIGALAEALPHCALAQIVQGIDDIRCLARDNGFAAVETLASRLESAVAGGGYRAAILTYLDRKSTR